MDQSDDPIPGNVPPPLVRALWHLLRPLVRLALHFNLPFTALSRLLKGVYVEVAEREFIVPGKEQTDSRISLLTGVHRKDVRRLRRDLSRADAIPSTVTLGAQLLALWLTGSAYIDDNGRPLPLPRLASEDASHSFEQLVSSVSTDIRPRAVLDEWLRQGVVHLDDSDRVWLHADAFIPEQGFEQKSHYFGENVHDHLAACVHNLTGGSPPLFERNVFSTSLSEESVEEVSQLARTKGMELIKAVSERAIALERRDAGSEGPRHRINLGVYWYQQEKDADQDEPPAEEKPS